VQRETKTDGKSQFADDFATVKRACEHLDISRASLYRLIDARIAVSRYYPHLGRRINLQKTKENLALLSEDNYLTN